MNRFDLLLYAVAAAFAVMSLVRLMLARRDRLIAEVQQQVATQKRQKKDF